MKNYLNVLIVLVFFSACSYYGDFKKKKFVAHTYRDGKDRKEIYKYVIPKEYQDALIVRAGGEGTNYVYVYSDSSRIYIGTLEGDVTAGGSRNNDLIQRRTSFVIEHTYQDTLLLEGLDQHGRYWKELNVGGLSFGYSNCPENKKQLYDRSLNSLKRR